jgi:hypothetical protein
MDRDIGEEELRGALPGVQPRLLGRSGTSIDGRIGDRVAVCVFVCIHKDTRLIVISRASVRLECKNIWTNDRLQIEVFSRHTAWCLNGRENLRVGGSRRQVEIE